MRVVAILSIELMAFVVLVTSEMTVHEKMDPRRCLGQPMSNSNKPLLRFEVLPGVGFDNLRNLDAGQVIMWTYEDCKTTEDGKYLIPDALFIVPVKESTLEIFADVFQHWSSYTSTTSQSINADTEAGFGGFEVSGKYSDEFESVKTHQVKDKSITTRVQVRHNFYSAKLQPDSPLHPSFKSRLLRIASNLQNNNTALARYLSQLLVRDYGTHVLTSADAGAALVKEDQIKNTFLNHTENSKNKIAASASASFFSLVKINGGFSNQETKQYEKQYLGNQTRSTVRTHGGPAFQSHLTVSSWEAGLQNELVAVDRSGDALHYFITTATLPELPEPTVEDLADMIRDTIQLYYKFNTYKGCTKQDAPNFSFQANLDDGSCTPPLTNFSFAGLYQTCKNTMSGAGNLCASLVHKNPLTGDLRCPSGYQSVLLQKGTSSKTQNRRVCNNRCRSCGLFGWGRCCHNECGNRRYTSTAIYQAFWCVALTEVPSRSGYLFGGLYTSTVVNPVTFARSCPLHFYALRMLADLRVCVSKNYELAGKFSLPFAGFFGCASGNPLAAPAENESGKVKHQQFVTNADPTTWPMDCPEGFSQHLATLDDSCEINYCLRMGALSQNKGLPKITRPPFSPRPSANPNSTDTLVVMGAAGRIWSRNDTEDSWTRIDEPDKASKVTWVKEILQKMGASNASTELDGSG